MFLALIFLIIVLFALSAFWSGSETALTSLSSSRVKKLIAMYPAWKETLRHWLVSPYYILSVILVGNTVTNMAISSLATFLAIKVFGVIAPRTVVEFFSWVVITVMLLIFGEVTPKIYCRRNPERVSVVVLPFYSTLEKFLSPLYRFIENIFKKLTPSSSENAMPFGRLASFSVEEMRQLFAETDLNAIVGGDASAMMYKVLNFGDIEVSKVMTPLEKIEGVCLDCQDENTLDKFVETSRSRIPVIRRNPSLRVLGYVHIKDILKALSSGLEKFDESFIRTPYIIPPDKKVGRLLREFQTGSSHIAFVSSSDGEIIGLITLEDILEELVGEIMDEYDMTKRGGEVSG